MIEIRTFRPDEWQVYRTLRLRALRDSPDAFGATLEQERHYPPSRWQSRLAEADSRRALPLCAALAGNPVGLAWGRIDPASPSIAHLYQMWASPEARGLGIGRRLLDAVIDWARRQGASTVELGVTVGNGPAAGLYAAAGFRVVGDPEPLRAGSELMTLTMRLSL